VAEAYNHTYFLLQNFSVWYGWEVPKYPTVHWLSIVQESQTFLGSILSSSPSHHHTHAIPQTTGNPRRVPMWCHVLSAGHRCRGQYKWGRDGLSSKRESREEFSFAFMLPCVVTDFLLITNQTHYLSKFILSKNSTCFGQSEEGTLVPSWLCLETAIITCTKITNAECTVEDSWWWAKKLPETCRVLWQNKLG